MIDRIMNYITDNMTDSMMEKLNVLGIVLLVNFLIVLVYWLWNIPFRPSG